jgi:hypothetical protein
MSRRCSTPTHLRQQYDRPTWQPLMDAVGEDLAAVPERLDFAIQAALCTWWLLADSTDADRKAIVAAVERAQAGLRA